MNTNSQTEPATWQAAATRCVAAINRYAVSPIDKDVRMPELRRQLDRLIDESQIDDRDRLFQIDWYDEFKALAATCDWVALNTLTPFADRDDIDDEFVRLIARKQHDYGPENILRFGVQGLLVRLHDKVARLENLLSKGGKNAVNGEAVDDTFTDIVGYCTVGMMLERGWFVLPLAPVAATA